MSKPEQSNMTSYSEAAQILQLLRALGSEEQRIAFALMEGMRIQKSMDLQKGVESA